MSETLATLQSLFTVAFVVSSMLVMGVSLTVGQIIQPLRNIRLVVLALVASFVVVPGTAYLLKQVIPMNEQLQIGLILMSWRTARRSCRRCRRSPRATWPSRSA